MPKMPKIDEVKPLSLEKICPACGKDLPPIAVKCDNPSCPSPFSVATTAAKPKPRKPDEKGSGGPRLQQHITTYKGMPINKTHIPGFSLASQSNMPIKPAIQPQPIAQQAIKPINKKRLISDDDAQISDEGHLQNVEHSATHLGL